MAHSLSPECTPLKHAYDSCFNAWFEGYLEPAVSDSPEAQAEYSKAKAEEYEKKCGEVWRTYRACIQKAVKEKDLEDLLKHARKDDPLDLPPATSSGGSR